MIIPILAAALALAPNSSTFTDVAPPTRYRGDAVMTVQTATQAEIDQACHPQFGTPPAGMKTDACTTGNRVIVPNPCLFPQSDAYAHLLCHEMGHVNGWPASHGD